ncbi:hypothetical protein [Lacticaseibacillus parakribbianus]|uniref:hypothetical protein n=1 Tax=Lacticaseibacillus parakribbianus TaxID=2970927 RepID=UPI0021CB1B77|nr:hypothetical protein [Lacticaseibacillus parakribbianus]
MAKQSGSRLNTILRNIEIAFFVGLVVVHLTPGIAVRWVLLRRGYVEAAVAARVVPRRVKHESYTEHDNQLIYFVEPHPVSHEPDGSYVSAYYVRTYGLSWAEPVIDQI